MCPRYHILNKQISLSSRFGVKEIGYTERLRENALFPVLSTYKEDEANYTDLLDIDPVLYVKIKQNYFKNRPCSAVISVPSRVMIKASLLGL